MDAWVQVLAALVCIAVLIAIAARVVRQEALVEAKLIAPKKQDVLVLRELTSTSRAIGTNASTHSTKADTIFDLAPSRDRRGGNQFSVSFRCHLINSTLPTERCLLLWGDPNYVKFDSSTSSKQLQHLLVFMPMITIGMQGDKRVVRVHFNTTGSILNTCQGALETEPPTFDLEKDGAVVTATFTDYDVNASSHGCMCNLYVDTRLVGVTKVEGSSIRRNPGLLYVLPSTDLVSGIARDQSPTNAGNVKVGELSYHNYEMDVRSIATKAQGKMTFSKVDMVHEAHAEYDASRDLAYHGLVTPFYS